MRLAAAVRSLLAIALTWAIVWMPAAPPVHAHPAGIEGTRAPLVHAHAQGAGAQAHDAGPGADVAAFSSEHGDHLLAIFLDATFEGVAKDDLQAAGLPAAFQLPEPRAGGTMAPATTARAHAPPLRVWVARGPPSLS
jgi:hypothetical protein